MRKTSVLLFLLLSAFLITGVACQPEKVTYRVTFDAGEEEFSDAQREYFSQGLNVFRGSKVIIPETTDRDDQAIYNSTKSKVVDSWLCKESGSVWNFDTAVMDDITLIAQWEDVV